MKISLEQMQPDFKNYLNEIYKQQPTFYNEVENYGKNRSSIVTKFGDLTCLDNCSKRLPLITDRNIFLEKIQPPQIAYADYSVMDTKVINYKSTYFGTAFEQTREEMWFRTNNFQDLESWFSQSKKMIDSKKVVYVPTFEKIRATEDFNLRFSGEDPGEFLEGSGRNLKVIKVSPLQYETPFRATMESDIETTDRSLIPLLQLDIPTFENISTSQLSQIMDDYPEEILRFRNYLQKVLLNLEKKIGSEDFYREIRLADLELNDGLMNLKNEFDQLKKVTAIEVIGAQLVTWSLYVYLFMSSPDNLLKIILPGGAISSLSFALAKYMKERFQLSNNPLNFLLIVNKKVKI